MQAAYNKMDTGSSALRKPPCLQEVVCKQPSFSSAAAQHQGRRAGKPLVRKQSLNHIPPPSTSSPTPLARKYSLGNLQLQRQHHLIRLEDDPFFMAIQACQKGSIFQKDPIRLYFHQAAAPPPPPPSQRQCRHDAGTPDFKHLTIRQLCKLQLQEEEEEEKQLKKVQREPLIVSHTSSQRKHKRMPFTILSRCLGC